MMNEVAVHLGEHAIRCVDAVLVDVFGRSAFNRFYYACYWCIRTSMPDLHPNWVKLGHKALPDYMSTTVKSDMLKRLEKLRSQKLVDGSAYGSLKARIEASIRSIALHMRNGYAIRCIADYEPDKKATKVGTSLHLSGHKISTIESLFSEVQKHVGVLKSCRSAIGL